MSMKCATVVVLAAALCCAAVLASGPAAFEGVDVAALLKNESAVAGYVKCILGTGECNESAKRLQAIVPNALQGKCSQCSEQQKVIIGTIVNTMQSKFPNEWEKLLQKYDPEKKYRADILALAKAVPTGAPTGTAATTAKPAKH